jgi:excinuclease ABC subunit C
VAKSRRDTWLDRAKELPESPGCYLMKDREGVVVYVGKAKNLRNRVSSYFQEGTNDYRAFVGMLSGVLGDLETLVTRSEKEALLLERQLIGRHAPRFNVIWRDDKQYLCLRVDPSHDYPWVQVVRQMGKDGARYFGPFHSASAARQTLRVVNRHFMLRTCRDSVLYNRTRPCLEYQIGRCPAPCVFEIDRDKYMENVGDVLMFLEGKGDELVEKLDQRMWEAAGKTEYEVAAHYRDQKTAVEKTLEKQKVALPSLLDQDVLGLYREGEDIGIAVLEVREGRIRNVSTQLFEGTSFADADLVESFLLQRYSSSPPEDTPREVLVPIDLQGAEALSEILTEHKKAKAEVKRPKRGDRADLLRLAAENAEHGFHEKRKKSGALDRTLLGLKERLKLRNMPMRIECYDISNFQGAEIVASRATFVRATPAKDLYRRYKVKQQSGQDDFGAMYEVLSRRFARGLAENDLPDLVVIDGGKGQLNVARAVFRDLGVEGVDLISLAKSRFEGDDERSDRSPERVFLPAAKDPLVLPQSSAELLLLARIRDEAHRFAVSFHRARRKKTKLESELETIPGVGPKRRKALLRQLGSLKRVREASVDELAAVPGIGPKAAARIWRALHPGRAGDSR